MNEDPEYEEIDALHELIFKIIVVTAFIAVVILTGILIYLTVH